MYVSRTCLGDNNRHKCHVFHKKCIKTKLYAAMLVLVFLNCSNKLMKSAFAASKHVLI